MKQHLESLKTLCILIVACTGVYLYNAHAWAIYLALTLALIGAFSPYLSNKIHFIWMKFAWVLGQIFPKILLSIIYFLLLTPIAWLASIMGAGDKLMLKRQQSSTFRLVNKSYTPDSFKKMW